MTTRRGVTMRAAPNPPDGLLRLLARLEPGPQVVGLAHRVGRSGRPARETVRHGRGGLGRRAPGPRQGMVGTGVGWRAVSLGSRQAVEAAALARRQLRSCPELALVPAPAAR